MTESFPTLAHAPIVEGLIDIQVSPVLDPGFLPQLEALHSLFPEFPIKNTKLSLTGELQLVPAAVASVGQTQVGYQFWEAAKTRVIQMRLDGVTASILEPYSEFSDLETLGKRVWAAFSDASRPKTISRVALRYINRIHLYGPVDLKDYFRTTPEISPDLPQAMAGYSMRLMVPDTNSPSNALITQVLESGNDGAFSVLFDIDVFQLVELRPKDSGLWDVVAELRDFKNRIFFKSITSRLEDMFR